MAARTRCTPGEWEVRGDARGETRFPFRTGMTTVVSWLVVSGGGRPSSLLRAKDRCPKAWKAVARGCYGMFAGVTQHIASG